MHEAEGGGEHEDVDDQRRREVRGEPVRAHRCSFSLSLSLSLSLSVCLSLALSLSLGRLRVWR